MTLNCRGGGTESNPYLITSAAELAGLASMIKSSSGKTYDSVTVNSKTMYMVDKAQHFKLMTDIDLNNLEWTPIGNMQYRFDGVFDGNKHTIKNVKMTALNDSAGLFGAIGTDARITNLGVDGISLKTPINNVTGSVVARCVGFGGLVGSIMTGGSDEKPMIDSCFAKNVEIAPTEKAMGNNFSGGLVGNVIKVSADKGAFYISNSYTYNVTIANHIEKGAFMGKNDCPLINGGTAAPHIKNCYAGGTISITDTTGSGSVIQNKRFAFCSVDCNTNNDLDISGLVNCFTSSAKLDEDSKMIADCIAKITYGATKETITNALATENSAFEPDSTVNAGYPVLAWEKPEAYSDGNAYYVKTLAVKSGKVNMTMVANDASVTATVYVAAYTDGGRLISVDEKSVSTVVSEGFETDVPSGTKTIKVFVWTDNMTPAANMQSKTL